MARHINAQIWIRPGTNGRVICRMLGHSKEEATKLYYIVDTIQQFLNAGLIEECFIHIAPLFLGSDIRLFDGIDKSKYNIEIEEVVPSTLTTHLKYKLKKK